MWQICWSIIVLFPVIFAEDRILHGKNAVKNYSFVVKLDIYSRNYPPAICTGTLISKRHVLTAAHCLLRQEFDSSDENVYDANVVYSRLVEHVKITFNNGKLMKSKKFSIGGRFNHWSLEQDIAIVHLPEIVNLEAINLASEFYEKPEEVTYILGYGYTEARIHGDVIEPLYSSIPEVLQEAYIATKSWNYCNETFSKEFDMLIPEDVICAGDNGQGILFGDSGGPMLMKAKNGRFFQVGISSFIQKTSLKFDEYPGVFTKVPTHCKWIETITKNEAKCEKFKPMKMLNVDGPFLSTKTPDVLIVPEKKDPIADFREVLTPVKISVNIPVAPEDEEDFLFEKMKEKKDGTETGLNGLNKIESNGETEVTTLKNVEVFNGSNLNTTSEMLQAIQTTFATVEGVESSTILGFEPIVSDLNAGEEGSIGNNDSRTPTVAHKFQSTVPTSTLATNKIIENTTFSVESILSNSTAVEVVKNSGLFNEKLVDASTTIQSNPSTDSTTFETSFFGIVDEPKSQNKKSVDDLATFSPNSAVDEQFSLTVPTTETFKATTLSEPIIPGLNGTEFVGNAIDDPAKSFKPIRHKFQSTKKSSDEKVINLEISDATEATQNMIKSGEIVSEIKKVVIPKIKANLKQKHLKLKINLDIQFD